MATTNNLEVFLWIIGSGLLMAGIALIGSFTFFLFGSKLEKFLLPLVAFSAGALIGGAFFHMIPASLGKTGGDLTPFIWVLIGFSLFFALEQFLHWHHCRRASATCKKPLTYLILIGDGLHNFIGGMAIAGTFLLDIRLGMASWLAAAAHEIPQELGDMAVMDLLRQLGHEKKAAVIVVTHDERMVKGFDRIYHLNDGVLTVEHLNH